MIVGACSAIPSLDHCSMIHSGLEAKNQSSRNSQSIVPDSEWRKPTALSRASREQIPSTSNLRPVGETLRHWEREKGDLSSAHQAGRNTSLERACFKLVAFARRRRLTNDSEPKTSPTSQPSPSIRCTETPVSEICLAIAHWMGAAPLNFGRREGCRFKTCREGNRERKVGGR